MAIAYLAEAVSGGKQVSSSTVLIGLAAGVIAGLVVDHKARIWIQRFRLRRLRVGGVNAQATVQRLEKDYTAGRGPGTTRYIVHVRWRDPATGAGWQGERRYRFSGRGSRRLESLCAERAKVPVSYPEQRPSRFVVDIPFAPTMADFFG